MTIEDLMAKAADLILTQTNGVGAVLGLGCYWLAGQWAKERIAHNCTIEKLFSLAEKQHESNASTAEALTALKVKLDTAK